MNVYTYHEPLPEVDRTEILSLWAASWRMNGWNPVILGRDIARRHPLYEPFLAKVNSMPTVNGREYETACYLRWLAMVVVGGGLMVDDDVVNLHQPPIAIPDYLAAWGMVSDTELSGTADQFSTIVQWIMDWEVDAAHRHISDMIIIHRHGIRKIANPPCFPYPLATPASSLVHCSYDWTKQQGKTQVQAIRELLNDTAYATP